MFPIRQYQLERDKEKNKILKKERHISFEEVEYALKNAKNIIDIIENPNAEKYPNQRHLIIKINSYPYVVPFVSKGSICFLKTIYANRKYKKL